MKLIYLVDLDGTVADLTHRLPLIKCEHPDWPAFFRACKDDQPIKNVIETIRLLALAGAVIVIVTGRSDECHNQTVEWMRERGVMFQHMYMREAGDYRPDHVIKKEILRQIREDVPGIIVGVFEDRDTVVDMYRTEGLQVFQVARGDY